jgi:DoxX-like family
MFTAYVAVTIAAAFACGYAAVLNLTHNGSVAAVARRLDVPTSWMVPLGFVLGAGAIGLASGFAVPALGTAAACGLVLYFLAAVAALVVGLAYRGPS